MTNVLIINDADTGVALLQITDQPDSDLLTQHMGRDRNRQRQQWFGAGAGDGQREPALLLVRRRQRCRQ